MSRLRQELGFYLAENEQPLRRRIGAPMPAGSDIMCLSINFLIDEIEKLQDRIC